MNESELRKKAYEILKQRSKPMTFEAFKAKPAVEHLNNYFCNIEKIILELKGEEAIKSKATH